MPPDPASHQPPQAPPGTKREERQATGAGWTDSGLIFATPTGSPLDPANLTRCFRPLLDRAGLRRIRFHDVPHSTATLLLEQDVDLVVIKKLLGRAHIGVTPTVYAHARLYLQRNAIDLLGHAFRSPCETTGQPDDGDDPPLSAFPVR
ncbi:tyrosine-type recombinase/integrase [Streptomyces benahoarensis]|uniref:tyrosine-type recombinase/integrase n=1 Tax=Streptomyces benahoarensis TaxID=2595054 RepID=UPI002035EDF6